MIIDKRNIVAFLDNKRVYFIHEGMFCSAYRKQGTHKTHGTLQNCRKRIGVKDSTIRKHGLVEESFLQKENGFVYGSCGERYTNPKLRGKIKS